MPSPAVRRQPRRRLVQLDTLGDANHEVLGHDHLLGVRAVLQLGGDAITRGEGRHPLPHRTHDAGKLLARDEGTRGEDLVGAGDDEDVREVQRRGRDVDKDLAGCGLRGVDLTHDELLRGTELLHEYRLHAWIPSLRCRCRYAP